MTTTRNVVVPVPQSRYAQLTYTSYAATDTSGGVRSGWQTKQHSPGISDSEKTLLLDWISTQLEPVTPLPPFPTQADIERLPRRLLYVPLPGNRAVYCHTVLAGADPAGRPGNIFAHLLLNRDNSGSERPIELWGSQDWLTPYGQTNVGAAEFESALPRPRTGSVATRTAALDFILDPDTWRIGVLSVLLDAVKHALRGGPRIVLACETPASAARWIAAVSHFMPAVAARDLGWSTFDRAATVAATLRRGLHVVAVPVQDASAIEDDERRVLIDVTADVVSGELGGADHRTNRGARITVTEWSELAQLVLGGHDVGDAGHTLADADSVADSLGRQVPSVEWPLAMAVARDTRYRDSWATAGRLIEAQSPDRLQLEQPQLWESVAGARALALGATVEDAGRALLATEPARKSSRFIWETFVERALRDPEWVRAERRDYPAAFAREPGQGPARLTGAARAAAESILAQAHAVTAGTQQAYDAGVAAVRLLELLAHAGLTGYEIDPRMQAALDRVLPDLLPDPDRGPRFVDEVGPVGESTRIEFVLPCLDPTQLSSRVPLGERIPAEVARWLVGPDMASFSALAANPRLIHSPAYYVAADLAYREIADRQRINPDRSAVALCRALAETREPERWCATDITPLCQGAPLDAERLLTIEQLFPDTMPVRFLARVITEEPSTRGRDLARRVRDEVRADLPGTPQAARADDAVRAWAALRVMVKWKSLLRRDLHDRGPKLLHDYARIAQPRAVYSELRRRLTVVYVFLRCMHADKRAVTQLGPEHAAALVETAKADPDDIQDALLVLIDTAVLDPDGLCALALLLRAQPDAVVVDTNDPLMALHDVLERVAQKVMGDSFLLGPADSEDLMNVIDEFLSRPGVTSLPQRDAAMKACKRQVAKWMPYIQNGTARTK
ncbi:GAP1-N2 domain-containing protein [Rhodococcus koreensis]